MTTSIQNKHPAVQPALRIQQLRASHRDYELTLDELAYLTGIPPQCLAAYESDRALPESIEDLVAVAAATQVRLEEVIDARVLTRIRARVADRRLTLESGENQRPPIGFRCRENG